MTLAAIAQLLSVRHGEDYDRTLTTVTSFAAQLDYDVPEGAPHEEVSDEDAAHIIAAFPLDLGRC